MTAPKLNSFFSLFIIIFIIAGFYTNCARDRVLQRTNSLNSAEAAYVPLSDLQRKLGTLYGSSFSPSICSESNRYFCDHRTYSPDLRESRVQAQNPCVQLGSLQICSKGLDINIDSSQLAESCLGRTCAPEDVDYSEYFCYLAVPNENGTFPIQGTYSSLSEGITDINNQCLNLSASLHKGSL